MMKQFMQFLFRQRKVSLSFVNYAGMCYTIVLSAVAVLVTTLIYIPFLYSHHTITFRALTLWTWFIFGNLAANYVLMLLSSTKSVYRGIKVTNPTMASSSSLPMSSSPALSSSSSSSSSLSSPLLLSSSPSSSTDSASACHYHSSTASLSWPTSASGSVLVSAFGSTGPSHSKTGYLVQPQQRPTPAPPTVAQQPPQTPANWKFCSLCDHYAPPRSRHCPFCQRCILRHDHHCLFTGCCIGLYNQRYFIVFCVYGWIGSFKAASLTLLYLSYVRGSSLYTYLPPNAFFNLLFGDLDLSIFCIALLLYLLFTTHLACTYFMCWQLLLLARKQTANEYVKGMAPLQKSFRHHVKSVFGPYWLLNFIIPMFWTNPSSGYSGSSLLLDAPFLGPTKAL